MPTSAFTVQVITLPVNDFDRGLRFYADRLGFALHDRGFRPTPKQG